MKNKTKLNILIQILFLLAVSAIASRICSAEKLKLKSGIMYEGEIISVTKKAINFKLKNSGIKLLVSWKELCKRDHDRLRKIYFKKDKSNIKKTNAKKKADKKKNGKKKSGKNGKVKKEKVKKKNISKKKDEIKLSYIAVGTGVNALGKIVNNEKGYLSLLTNKKTIVINKRLIKEAKIVSYDSSSFKKAIEKYYREEVRRLKRRNKLTLKKHVNLCMRLGLLKRMIEMIVNGKMKGEDEKRKNKTFYDDISKRIIKTIDEIKNLLLRFYATNVELSLQETVKIIRDQLNAKILEITKRIFKISSKQVKRVMSETENEKVMFFNYGKVSWVFYTDDKRKNFWWNLAEASEKLKFLEGKFIEYNRQIYNIIKRDCPHCGGKGFRKTDAKKNKCSKCNGFKSERVIIWK